MISSLPNTAPITDSHYIQPAQHFSHSLTHISQNEQNLIINCTNDPASRVCSDNIHYALWYLHKQHFAKQLPHVLQSAKNVLNVLYNGDNAKNLFLSRINDINTRAIFFAVNHLYYQHSSVPVRWFGVADKVSRDCLTGLGAKHCGSYIPFAVSKVFGNPAIYTWRQQGGETLLTNGFDNFKALFNGKFYDTVRWDIDQLNTEQTLLQPIHEAYLTKYKTFRKVNKTIMRLKIKGGVEILNKADRLRYGCILLRYSEEQNCVS